jgi:enterochelin esterase-like enzyme
MRSYQIRSLIHDSDALKRRKKRVIALVPDDAADGPIAICYYLHGWGGTAEAFLNHGEVFKTLCQTRQISVFPESFRNWFINDCQGNRYEDYLIGELVPAVEAEWLRVGPNPRRMIAGFSMGGLSALCMTWRYPHLFSGLACFAGAFEAPQRTGDPYAQFRHLPDLLIPTERDLTRAWGEPDSAVRCQYDPYQALRPTTLLGKQVYLSIGTRDFERMIAMNRRFHRLLDGAGVPHRYEEYNHGHDIDLVASSLPSAVEHLLARESVAA